MTPQDSNAKPTSIEPGRHVRLHLAIHLEDGTEVLSSFDDQPLAFVVGDGTLAAGLESLLLDLPVGSDTQTLADGSAIYGEPDPALMQTLEPGDLPVDFAPEPGQVVCFGTPGGQETAGTVVSSGIDGVRMDFNHPLSRRGLRVRVQVLSVD
jgi:FKBP-type peptidyl-prolyl cis-trans isomerase SlpA